MCKCVSCDQQEKEVVGYASLRVPPLPPGKTYTLRISTTPQELVRVSTIKVLATQESSTIYPQVCRTVQTNISFRITTVKDSVVLCSIFRYFLNAEVIYNASLYVLQK